MCSVNIHVPAPSSITESICSQSIHFSICFAKNFELGVTEAFFLPFFICCNKKTILSSILLCEIHIKQTMHVFIRALSLIFRRYFFFRWKLLVLCADHQACFCFSSIRRRSLVLHNGLRVLRALWYHIFHQNSRN